LRYSDIKASVKTNGLKASGESIQTLGYNPMEKIYDYDNGFDK
jgi:hypothetical protein